MSRLPVRWRLTVAFACVMAILLTATGVFVRQQLRANLDSALDAFREPGEIEIGGTVVVTR